MKVFRVYKRGYENDWFPFEIYKESDGYDLFFNMNIFTIRKDGYIILQGGADNFYYEVENEKNNS